MKINTNGKQDLHAQLHRARVQLNDEKRLKQKAEDALTSLDQRYQQLQDELVSVATTQGSVTQELSECAAETEASHALMVELQVSSQQYVLAPFVPVGVMNSVRALRTQEHLACRCRLEGDAKKLQTENENLTARIRMNETYATFQLPTNSMTA